MAKIAKDKATQIMVFVVNIDSPSNHHVRIGNVIYDIPKPRSLAVQAALVAATAILVPYQKQRLAGIPNTMAATKGRFSHQLQIYCEYN
jgi:hypothetical protein